jgi:hypothetical protein
MKRLFFLDWRSDSKGIKIPATATSRFFVRTTKQILVITITMHNPILINIKIEIPSRIIPFLNTNLLGGLKKEIAFTALYFLCYFP